MNWLLIGVVLIALFFLFKSKEVKHRVMSILIIVLVLFFIVSFSQVVSKVGNIGTFDGLLGASKMYFLWLKTVFGNVGHLTGNAIKLDWSANLTNLSR